MDLHEIETGSTASLLLAVYHTTELPRGVMSSRLTRRQEYDNIPLHQCYNGLAHGSYLNIGSGEDWRACLKLEAHWLGVKWS